MKRSHVAILVLAGMAVFGGLAACSGRSTASPEENRVELKVYGVPEGYENEVRRMLRNALGTDENQIGRVDVGPGGKLVVVAPPRIQDGIGAFLRELKSLEVPLTSPKPISLTYWLLVGRPLQGGGRASYTMARGVDPREAAPALEQIAASQGPTEFRLLERIRLASTDDRDWARTQGSRANISQRATTTDGKVVAEIQIDTRAGNSVSTEVVLDPGQFLVLGQAGFAGRYGEAFDEGSGKEPLTLYYVVVATVEP